MTNKRKPENVITKIRTGTGDAGTTYFRGEPKFPKASQHIEYLGALDSIQAFLVLDETPADSSDEYRKDIRLAQNLVFALGANFNSPENEKYQDKIRFLTKTIETRIPEITRGLEPLKGFIRTIAENKNFRQAGVFTRQAELLINKIVRDFEEDAEYCCFHRVALNILSDFLFALAWASTVDDEDGSIPESLQWTG
jgi:cob(I)alamin adenosyltransferase